MEDLGIKTRIGVDHFCYFISHGDLSGNAAPIEDQSYTVNGRNYPVSCPTRSVFAYSCPHR